MRARFMVIVLKNFLHSLRAHWLICVSGLALSLVVSMPLILFPAMNRDVYQGINIQNFGRDQLFYMTRAKEVLQGHHLGNAVLREGKDGQEMQISYVEYLAYTPYRLLGVADRVDIDSIFAVHNFVGVFVLILLIYACAYQLARNKLFAALVAISVVGGYPIIFFKAIFRPEVMYYGRGFSPYLIEIPFFIFLNALVKYLRTPEKRYGVFAGLAYGALFYVYFFAWTFASAMLGMLVVIFLFKKEWQRVRHLLFIMGTGILLGAYNLILMVQFHNTDAGKRLFYYLWSVHTHTPVFSAMGFASLVLFGIYKYFKRTDTHWPFILAIIVSGWIVLNQQVILGQITQPAHYYWFFIVPLGIVTGLYMFWELSAKAERIRRLACVFLLVFIPVNAAVGQYRAEFDNISFKRSLQPLGPVVDFLNKEKTPGVVLTNDEDVSHVFTVYTNHDAFWNYTAGVVYNTPLERMKDALYVYVYLNKHARNNFVPYMADVMADGTKDFLYREPYRAVEGYLSGFDLFDYNAKAGAHDSELMKFRAELLGTFDKEYTALSKDGKNIENLLKRYGVTHIVWDTQANPEWDLSFIRGRKKVFSSGTIDVFTIEYER